MADLEHRTSRIVDQRPEIVHDRLLELADRLRREMPPVKAGTQTANVLGVNGQIGMEVADRGPNRIELRTTEGRIRGEGVAEIAPTGDGRTTVTMSLAIRPEGFAANMMLGVALKTMPGVERQLIEGLETSMTDLATELAKPDGEWDANAWQPPGLPTGR